MSIYTTVVDRHWTIATWSHMIWANCWCWLCVVGVHTDYRLPCSSLQCPANIIASLPLMVSLTSDQCARDLSGVNIDTASTSGDGDTMKTLLIVLHIILCAHCFYIGEENNEAMISEVSKDDLSVYILLCWILFRLQTMKIWASVMEEVCVV